MDAADDAALGRFYAENDFIPELDGISDKVFEMLDFAGIGRMMRCSENGVFWAACMCCGMEDNHRAPRQKTLPSKPSYLFRLAPLVCILTPRCAHGDAGTFLHPSGIVCRGLAS